LVKSRRAEKKWCQIFWATLYTATSGAAAAAAVAAVVAASPDVPVCSQFAD